MAAPPSQLFAWRRKALASGMVAPLSEARGREVKFARFEAVAGEMVGNGGTAVRVTAWCLAWREQDVTGKRSKSCGGWPRGWPA